jgi:hypothetical protein
MRELSLEARFKGLNGSGLCLFRMRHSVETECFRKGTNAKLSCTALECKWQPAEELHEMFACEITFINGKEYKED